MVNRSAGRLLVELRPHQHTLQLSLQRRTADEFNTRRSRLDSFKSLGKTLNEHFQGVARGMLEQHSNAFVETMNGILQQAKRAARGFSRWSPSDLTY